MKAFFIIILVFFVTLGCIIHNAISVRSFASEYEGQLAGLEYSDAVGFSTKVSNFASDINKKLDKLGFSLPARKVSQLRDSVSQLLVLAKQSQSGDYEVIRALTINQLRSIAELERINPKNIF